MDNIITGVLAVGLFAAFVFGLAASIGALPFAIIVTIVVSLLVYDFVCSVRSEKDK